MASNACDERDREEGEHEARADRPELAERLEEQGVGVSGLGGDAPVLVPPGLVPAGAHAVQRLALERVHRRGPELVAAGGAPPAGGPLARAGALGRGRGGLEVLVALHRVGDHDRGDDQDRGGGDRRPGERGRHLDPRQRRVDQPARESDQHRHADREQEQLVALGRRELGAGAVEHLVARRGERDQGAGADAGDRQPGHDPGARRPGDQQGREPDRGGDQAASRGARVDRRHREGDRADRDRAAEAALRGDPKPPEQDDRDRHHRGEAVPVSDRVARPAWATGREAPISRSASPKIEGSRRLPSALAATAVRPTASPRSHWAPSPRLAATTARANNPRYPSARTTSSNACPSSFAQASESAVSAARPSRHAPAAIAGRGAPSVA